jgi:hypothetical protein
MYQRFFWDWAENVERRPGTFFADLLGSHRHTVRACVDRLEETGIIRVVREARQARIELIFEGVLQRLYVEIDSTFGESSGPSESPSNVEIDSTLDARAEIWRLPVELEPRSLTPCYVTVYDTGKVVGTVLANTASIKLSSLLTTYVYSCINYKANVEIDAMSNSAPPAGSTSEPVSNKKKVTKRKATGQRSTPTKSFGFRWATKEQILADSLYPRIEALHKAWCQELSLDYELTGWRYAAWRQALVEQGYTEEQVMSAIPALQRDSWWLERASDPHDMFGTRPERIERFFPGNVKSAPDRHGRSTPSTDESFTF